MRNKFKVTGKDASLGLEYLILHFQVFRQETGESDDNEHLTANAHACHNVHLVAKQSEDGVGNVFYKERLQQAYVKLRAEIKF